MRTLIKCNSICDYELVNRNSDRAILLLHGYAESSSKIIKNLKEVIPKDYDIIAPNGPFPLPEKIESGYKLGFAWYFFDNINDKYFIDHKYPTEFLINLIKLHLKKYEQIIIIGYSQGGYLAPFIANELENCKNIFCINSQIKYERLKNKKVHYQTTSINSEKDLIVEFDKAKMFHKGHIENGNHGKFISNPNGTHRICQNILKILKKELDCLK